MSDAKAPGPVRSWKDMSPEERARVAAGTKPPPRERAVLPYASTGGRRASSAEGTVALRVSCRVRESADAVLYVYEGEEVWVPKSVLRSADGEPTRPETASGDDYGSRERAVEVEVARWWAEKRGLVE